MLVSGCRIGRDESTDPLIDAQQKIVRIAVRYSQLYISVM